ncbi:MAG: peptidylprolyl isomerase [Acidobacteria bacterium]|nr:peptidylprolyl isomerase [Acidobacteriota bacterium]MBI3654940.1 peptidylprolyl isomerase [Acidobacteriota bacterium]
MKSRGILLVCLGVLLIGMGCSRIKHAVPMQFAAMQTGKEPSGQTAVPSAGPLSQAPATTGSATFSSDSLPEVVAEVNGETVKKNDLLEQVRVVEAQMGAVPTDKKKAFVKAVLDDIVGQKLLFQDAHVKKIVPLKEETEKQMSEFRKQFPDAASFAKALKDEGLTEDKLRLRVNEQLTMKQYVDTLVAPNLKVSEADAKKFYDGNSDKMKEPEQIKARHILIRVDAKADAKTKQEARARTEGLLKRAKANEDFAALAKANSDDTGSKDNGGDLDYFAKGQMVPEFDKAAWALKTNEISGVVETPYGFHIIKLTDHKPEKIIPFEQAKEQVLSYLRRQGVSDKLQSIVQELRAKGKIKIAI